MKHDLIIMTFLAAINYAAYIDTLLWAHLLTAGFITGLLVSLIVFRIGAEAAT